MRQFYKCKIRPTEGDLPCESAPEDVLRIVDIMKPKESPLPLRRLGGKSDGAYLLPDDFEGIRACFSPGLSIIKGFEDDVAESFSIRSHMCDFSSDVAKIRTPLIDGMQTFDKQWLDIHGSEDSVCLEDWVAAYCSEDNDDLLLQMDIEGVEYRNLLDTPEATLRRFRIIAIELHGLDKLNDSEILDQAIGPCLSKLGALVTCVHAHPNNCCGEWKLPGNSVEIPKLIELTFHRNDFDRSLRHRNADYDASGDRVATKVYRILSTTGGVSRIDEIGIKYLQAALVENYQPSASATARLSVYLDAILQSGGEPGDVPQNHSDGKNLNFVLALEAHPLCSSQAAEIAHLTQLAERQMAEMERIKTLRTLDCDLDRQKLAGVQQELAALRFELDAVYRSRSWRITGPLRKFKTKFSNRATLSLQPKLKRGY